MKPTLTKVMGQSKHLLSHVVFQSFSQLLTFKITRSTTGLTVLDSKIFSRPISSVKDSVFSDSAFPFYFCILKENFTEKRIEDLDAEMI